MSYLITNLRWKVEDQRLQNKNLGNLPKKKSLRNPYLWEWLRVKIKLFKWNKIQSNQNSPRKNQVNNIKLWKSKARVKSKKGYGTNRMKSNPTSIKMMKIRVILKSCLKSSLKKKRFKLLRNKKRQVKTFYVEKKQTNLKQGLKECWKQ